MQVQLPLDALRLRQLNVAVVLVMVVGWNGEAGGVVGGLASRGRAVTVVMT